MATSPNEEACAIKTGGDIVCWGKKGPKTNAPTGSHTQVALGADTACGLRTDGYAVCWAGSGTPPFVKIVLGTEHQR